MSQYAKVMAAVVLLCGSLAVGGCARDRTTASDVRRNWSPELHTLTEHREMHRTRRARTVDSNIRMLREDIDRVLLLDKPSQLTHWDLPR